MKHGQDTDNSMPEYASGFPQSITKWFLIPHASQHSAFLGCGPAAAHMTVEHELATHLFAWVLLIGNTLVTWFHLTNVELHATGAPRNTEAAVLPGHQNVRHQWQPYPPGAQEQGPCPPGAAQNGAEEDVVSSSICDVEVGVVQALRKCLASPTQAAISTWAVCSAEHDVWSLGRQ